MKKLRNIFLSLLLITSLSGCKKKTEIEVVTITPTPSVEVTTPETTSTPTVEATQEVESNTISEDTTCDDKACVSEYLYTYEHLPSNYMTKKEAKTYGWEGGPLWKVVEGMCIGGDRFGNYEENLPTSHNYYECDIDTLGANSRGAKRIIYSDDGLIYYTDDHYETFELLYGEE